MADARSHLDRYTPATWRSVTAVKDGWICMSFNQDGKVVRLRLSVRDAYYGAGEISFHLEKWASQSPRSSEIPKVLGSPNQGQVQYPFASSSAAVCGSPCGSSEPPSNTMCQRPSACNAIQKVPRRVAWLYATGLILISFIAGVAVASTTAVPMPGMQPRDPSPMQEQTNGPFAPSSR